MLGKARKVPKVNPRAISSRYLDKNAFFGALQVRHQDGRTRGKEGKVLVLFFCCTSILSPGSPILSCCEVFIYE